MKHILQTLGETENRYATVEELLAQPSAASDPAVLRSLMQEYSRLTPIMECYRAYRSLEQRKQEAEPLCGDLDADLRALAEEECRELEIALEEKERELTVLLLPHDPNDEKNVAVEIRAGAGGEEAALFAGALYRMYGMYADRMHYRVEPISATETELGGYREIRFLVEGAGAYSRLKYESGVHRVQRVPETEAAGRIHTSTVTVAVLPEAEEVAVHIDPSEIQIESCKSSGAGGQHINKTESAVRLLHKPTGIVVECQEERSQFKNRDKAMKMLRTILYDRQMQAQNAQIASERRRQVGTGDRSERIRTYNYPQGRVTDHRIGLTLYTLDSILNGEIGGIIDALAAADTAEKLNHHDD